MKKTILLYLIILLILPVSLALYDYDQSNILIAINMTDEPANLGWTYDSSAGAFQSAHDGVLTHGGFGAVGEYSHSAIFSSGQSYTFMSRLQIHNATSPNLLWHNIWEITNGAYRCYAALSPTNITIRDWNNNVKGTVLVDLSSSFNNVSIIHDNNNNVSVYVNDNVMLANFSNACVSPSNNRVLFGSADSSTIVLNQTVEYFVVYEALKYLPPPAPFVDTTPPTMNFLFPAENNSVTNQNPFNFSIEVSDDSATEILCDVRNASNYVFDSGLFANPSISNLTVNLNSDTVAQNYIIECRDMTEPNNNSRTEIIRLTMDKLAPLLVVNSPSNNSILSSDFFNITIDATCNDLNITSVNYTLYNSSGIIAFNGNDTNIDNHNLNLLDSVDTTLLADGIYSMNITCFNQINIDSELLFIEIDSTKPVASGIQISSTNISAGSDVEINITCSDINMNVITVESNITGSFTQNDVYAVEGTTKLTYNHTAQPGFNSHRFFCFDSAGNSALSSEIGYNGFIEIISLAIVPLPLENISVIVGMLVLFILSIQFIFGFNGNKK